MEKLNTKRVILVGFAFFLISAFWQAYDAIVPLMLTNRFGLLQTFSGAVMALDNVLALFLLPLFGALSDKTKHKMGKRTPYILIGTICAIIAFVILTFVDNMQLLAVHNAGVPNIVIPDGTDSAEKLKILMDAAWAVTASNPLPLVLFIGMLLVTLVSMSLFRSPAVALMPDVTIKPLRSKANAIINLMGTAGGIFVLGLGLVFKTGGEAMTYASYTWYVVAVCALMAIALVVFMVTVKEPKWNNEMLEKQALLDAQEDVNKDEINQKTEAKNEKMDKGKLKSMILILASVALWFCGYNAVTSKYSLYANNVLNQDYNLTLIIAQAAAIVAFVPAGILASKLGRKKTILVGICLLATAFFAAIFITAQTPPFLMYVLFALAGIGWATINVNSFPMVVELATGSNIGKYTGYYYTASMAAQVITPILSGALFDLIDMKILFPYATIFVALSFVTMLFVKHGNAQDLGGKSAKELVEDNFSADAD